MNRPILAHIEAVYYPILAAFGVSANLLTTIILIRGRCGLSKCISRYLLAMAISDLMVIIFEVILHEVKEVYFKQSLLDHTSICSLILTLIPYAVDCSVWLTVAFTFDRFIAICYQKTRGKYCTENTAARIIASVYLLSFLLNIPVYFMIEPGEVIDNTPAFCVVKSVFYTSLSWMAFYWIRTLLTPFTPFLLIAVFNALTIRHIIRSTKVRKQLRGSWKGCSQRDVENENRRKSIVLLLTISGSFILLWATDFLYEMFVHITEIRWFQTDYTDPFTIMEKSGYMLQRLSSCTNTVIYAAAQAKFRAEMLMLIYYPFALLAKYIKCDQ